MSTKSRVLGILEKNTGTHVSGEQIASMLSLKDGRLEGGQEPTERWVSNIGRPEQRVSSRGIGCSLC